MNERFDELLGEYLEGDLSTSGSEELDRLLEAQPNLADTVADQYSIHRGLGLIHQEKDPDLFTKSTMKRMRGDQDAFVGVAAISRS